MNKLWAFDNSYIHRPGCPPVLWPDLWIRLWIVGLNFPSDADCTYVSRSLWISLSFWAPSIQNMFVSSPVSYTSSQLSASIHLRLPPEWVPSPLWAMRQGAVDNLWISLRFGLVKRLFGEGNALQRPEYDGSILDPEEHPS